MIGLRTIIVGTMSCFLVAPFVGCESSPTESAHDPLTAADLQATSSTLEGAVRSFIDHTTRGPTKRYPFTMASSWYERTHRDEILKTLEIVRVEENIPFGMAFFRFSIGTVICRDSQAFHNLEGVWLPTYIPHFSEYSPPEKTIHIEHIDFLKKMDEESDEWKKEQPKCWFR